MGRVEGKVALISGGAGGIGSATARLLAAEGASVVVADVVDDAGKELANELGDRGLFVHLDVTDEAGWSDAVAQAEERFGRLDALLNNAGLLRFGAVEKMPLEEYMQVVTVNQVGVFLGMKTAVPALKRAGGGSIVNVSSVEGIRGSAGLVAYVASKFAVRGMTKAAAVELGPDGIRVNSIHPGTVDTPMLRAQGLEDVDVDKMFRGIPLGRAARPADIANMFLFLTSDESAYCSGAEFVVDGGATQFIGWFHKHYKMT
jgi:3alpha(or 20beta)-hydroxysteroid dehydrogenase